MSLRMPAIWSSSERPISVRTVWVDGVRHAILSADDPLVRQGCRKPRPRTSRGSNYTDESYYPAEVADGGEDLGECFVKLHLVAALNERVEQNSVSGSLISGRNSPGISRGKCQRSRANKGDPERIFCPIGETTGPEREIDKIITSPVKIKNEQNHRKGFCEEIDQGSCKLPDIQQNSLSERVLQWLDLSGRVKEYQRAKNLVSASATDSSKEASSSGPGFSVRKKSAPETRFRRRGSSAVIIPKERILVQNYTLQTGQSREKDCGRRTATGCGNAAEEDAPSGASQHSLHQQQRRKDSSDSSEITPPVRSYFVDRMNNLTGNDRRVCMIKSSEGLSGQFEDEGETKQSLWSPPRKPQLHIFMPSLISTIGEKVLSSQEQQINNVDFDQQF